MEGPQNMGNFQEFIAIKLLGALFSNFIYMFIGFWITIVLEKYHINL